MPITPDKFLPSTRTVSPAWSTKVPHMQPGNSIMNTTSLNAYKGNSKLLSYSTTKGAILAFTRSIAEPMLEKGIRVNGVAPGPISKKTPISCWNCWPKAKSFS